jgi:hypothetical protein
MRVNQSGSLILTSYLIDLLFKHEDGDSKFLRNIDELAPDYMVSYPIK